MLILAPLSAGKTFFVHRRLELGDRAFVDGDDLAKNTVGWPIDRWWLDHPSATRALAERTHDKMASRTAAYLRANPSKFVLSNCDPHRLRAYVGTANMMVVVPPRATLLRNFTAKRAGLTRYQTDPVTFDEVLLNTIKLVTFAKAEHFTVYSSFEGAWWAAFSMGRTDHEGP